MTKSYVERDGDQWRACVIFGGKRRRGKRRKTKREAIVDARQLLEQRELGGGAGDPTLGEAVRELIWDARSRNRREATVDFYRDWGHGLARHFGEDTRLSAITPEGVQDLLDSLRDRPTSAKHMRQVLTRMCRLNGRPSPASDPRLILPAVRHRDPGQAMSWADAVSATQHDPILRFILGFGTRRTETARLRAADLDVPGRRVVVPIGKTRPRVLPMPDAAVDVCTALLALARETEFLLPGDTERRRIDFLQGMVARARAETGERRLQLHELRRCFGSRVAETATVPVAAALLGHSLPGVVGHYVRADEAALRAAMDAVWSTL